MTYSAAATLVSLFFFLSYAIGQRIVAPSCDPSWNWASNSLGQNPCLVLAYMASTCNGGAFNITPLDAGEVYTGPYGPDNSNLCKCNTVAYSLISACGGCQVSNWITWSEYITNCTTIMPPSSFPNPVPDGTRVPHWALINTINQNLWDANQSYAIGDNPEIAPGTLITSSKAKLNTGAIAGGVVGGIAAISAAIAALFFCRRRRRARAPPGPTVIDERTSGFNSLISQVPRSMSGPETVASSVPDADPSMLRFYNPNDPTTYPNYQGPSPPSMYSRNSTGPPSGPYPSSGRGPHVVNPAPNSGPRYSGFPEPDF